MGWSLPVIESMQKLNKPFVVVSFPDFENYAKENNIPFVPYQFDEWSDSSNSLDLKDKLEAFNVDVAVPLFEETVEWAGALNSLYRDDPKVLNRAFLFRNKDIEDKCQDDDFPCLAESHLSGKEFSCEAFVHGGKIRFLNITEYVKLGYSNFIPEGNYLHTKRDRIMKEMQKLVDLFGIQY